MNFHQILLAIHDYVFPKEAAYVTIWWHNWAEAEKIMALLRERGYRVNYYRGKGETEIRFSYTYASKVIANQLA